MSCFLFHFLVWHIIAKRDNEHPEAEERKLLCDYPLLLKELKHLDLVREKY